MKGNYNSQFSMRDFFMNKKLETVFPQFSENEINKPSDIIINDKLIINKIADYLATVLMAERTANGIVVVGVNYNATLAKIRTLAKVCEDIFSSSESVVKNIKSKSRLYTTISTIDQLKSLQNITQKIAVMNQVLENINYNRDFMSQASVAAIEKNNSKSTFERRQIIWENKVGYKPDPRLAKMNASTNWKR